MVAFRESTHCPWLLLSFRGSLKDLEGLLEVLRPASPTPLIAHPDRSTKADPGTQLHEHPLPCWFSPRVSPRFLKVPQTPIAGTCHQYWGGTRLTLSIRIESCIIECLGFSLVEGFYPTDLGEREVQGRREREVRGIQVSYSII